jgi:hypothetical protein
MADRHFTLGRRGPRAVSEERRQSG